MEAVLIKALAAKIQGSIKYAMKLLARRLLLLVSPEPDHLESQNPAAEIRQLSMDKVVFLCNLHCYTRAFFYHHGQTRFEAAVIRRSNIIWKVSITKPDG